MNKTVKLLAIAIMIVAFSIPCYSASKQEVKEQKRADALMSMYAGKYDGRDSYIIIGVAEKDGPGYIITTNDDKTVSLAATAKTELHPYWIKPEKMAKVLVRYVNNDGMRQAIQIYDAKNSYIDKKTVNGLLTYSLEKNENKNKNK